MKKLDEREIHLKAIGSIKDFARKMMLKHLEEKPKEEEHHPSLKDDGVEELADQKASELGPVSEIDAHEEGDEGHEDLHHLPAEECDDDEDDMKPTLTLAKKSRPSHFSLSDQLQRYNKSKKGKY